MVKKFLKEYFSFSRREQNGILVLASIILILILVNLGISWLPENRNPDTAEVQGVLEDFGRINRQKRDLNGSSDDVNESGGDESKRELFYFDPNQISEGELLKLGIHKKVVTTLLRYTEKGGRFHKKEDLLKIYGMDTSIYEELEPFIRIGPQVHRDAPDQILSFKDSIIRIIELNIADTNDLLPLKGIGPVLARRILKYRNILGGFAVKDQLLEVYGISRAVFQEISPVIEVDSTLVVKLNLNHSTYADLIRHPYFDQELTQAILNYRREHGSFHSVSLISREGIATEEEYQKILPYICAGR